MKRILLAFFAALAATTASADDFSVPVTAEFGEESLQWTGGLGKSYEFRWNVVLVDGKVAICGAGRFLDPTTRMQTNGLLRQAKVKLDGRVVMKDLSYFAQYKKAQDLGSAKANCRSTGVAPKGADSQVELDISGRARF